MSHSECFAIPPRDVENDETMFYLVLPADFKKQDAEAEVFALSRVGKSVRYLSPSDKKSALDSIDEGGPGSSGNSLVNSSGNGTRRSSDGDDSSVTSTGSKSSSRFSPFRSKRVPAEHQEVIYQFRVLLDGNEKFIWLSAAAELGRLCPETAVSLVSQTVDVTK